MSSILENTITIPEEYIETLLWIRNKHSELVPLQLNPIQRKVMAQKRAAVAAGKPPRFVILKYRRGGITTLEQAFSFWMCATQANRSAVTIAHDRDSTDKIFRISNLFYERLLDELKPGRRHGHNKRNLDFPGLNSLFSVGTAGSRAFGRGDTLNRVHGSEVAWWPGDIDDQRALLTGLTEACSEGEVSLESTPNSLGNLFHELCVEAGSGHSDWTLIFLPWWEDTGNRIRLTPEQARELAETYSDEEKELRKLHGLKASQIAWRRRKQRQLKHLFPQEYPEDEVSCFIVTGSHFFDISIMQARGRVLRRPIEESDNGALRIWAQPVSGHRYVAGIDVCEGTPHGDFAVVFVLDADDSQHVATYHARVRPETLGRKAAELGLRYNTALLGVEANNHGHSCLNTLRNTLHYPRLYVHREYDAMGGKPKLGWQTTPKTRPILLDDLKEAMEEGYLRTDDVNLIRETFTFEDNGTGKYEARTGYHDDILIAGGIAWQLRKRASMGPKVTTIGGRR